MNFTTLQGLTIPEGVVTQITDASGRVIWAVSGGKPVVLQVEKITSDTYAGETTYTGEQFILFNIYPKTNGTVSVTYGGLTKTITDTSGAAEPNAQQVFFGTFNGVSDSVATPASGELTFEGDCYAFAQSAYYSTSKNLSYCSCITAVVDMGEVESIPLYAFYKIVNTSGGTDVFPDESEYLAELIIPNTVRSIGNYAMTLLHKQSYSSGTDSWSRSVAKKIIMLAETPPDVATDSKPFGSDKIHEDFTIVVPKGCGNAYKTATGWSNYANYIVEAS